MKERKEVLDFGLTFPDVYLEYEGKCQAWI